MTAGLKQDAKITTLPFADVPHADRAGNLRRVFVRDMIIHTSIGVYEHEKEAPQRVRINLDLAVLEGDGVQNDDITTVLSYEDLVVGTRRICQDGHTNLVETLGEKLADMCLADPRVRKVIVRVEKLDVFEDAAAVGVEIERHNIAR
ncbi:MULTISPECIES: dihydroneopterin aldolase [Thalassospira]|uniref:7,8-dihydroneopterin aldolase n=2 Tax=Thalassospira TaxID=168934 RepID=A0ABX0WWJ3_9PROT|nr:MULTISPECIES: dihydroneopterin aldolase [Thalassospira]MBE71023.1 dihydroneopterin aldolase [Thalassospira sp.]AXO13463.1 dihydroneopterin aldolase [Thalassospira indica]EKF09705.1 Dihydroneopterin aldolase family protein [Thalassospira profundimaris WP0211]MBP3125063.1 dihydroneopterin aldolase [Thalassospira sp. ER-Se-21-Dark]NJB73703.1 dihydroneopterin aldolase [Thalassospira tepidiphila]